MKRQSELLMPVGSLEMLKVAVLYGADAVYMGTPDLSLRTRSKLSLEDVINGIDFAHKNGKRVYLTLNLFSHNRDIEKLPEFLKTIRKVKPDGVIIADPGVFQYVRENAPDLELHVSTQANICSWLSVKFWEEQGASLVVLAREVSFAELKEIREKCPNIRIETFIHGAMCMTYSGRCLLSNYMAERGANQGNCANSCRWKYKIHVKLKDGTLKDIPLTDENKELLDFFLEEEQRKDEFLQIEEDDRGSYILNSKDLCLMPKLNEYLEIGVDSLKVEGRNRSAYYAAITARAYRKAIDDWRKDPENWSADSYMKELMTVPTRGYSLAFHNGRLSHHAHDYNDTHTFAGWEYAGIIVEVTEDAFLIDIKNRIMFGNVLEFVSPITHEPLLLRIYEFEDVNNKKVTREEGIHAGQQPLLRIAFDLFHEEDKDYLIKNFPVNTVLRKERSLQKAEWERLKLDKEAMAIEGNSGKEEKYQIKRDEFVKALDEKNKNRTFKSPRIGAEGCCGRGCNGCLHFWNDEKYAKAREKLRLKKQGELLSSKEIKETEE